MIALTSSSSSTGIAADCTYSVAVHSRKALGLTDIKFEAETVDRYYSLLAVDERNLYHVSGSAGGSYY